MSKLEELIAELCPDGVEYKTLGEIYDFQYGTGNVIPVDGGDYPVYGSNGIVGSHNVYNSEDSPVIGHIGAYAGIVNWGAGKHFVTYNGVICKHKNTLVNRKFAYYLLLMQNFGAKSKNSSQPFVSYSTLMEPKVAVPPLKVQHEIVRILDNFTELTAELTAELTRELAARKKQYEYYLNYLINNNVRESNEYIKLGELFDFRNGLSKGKEFFGKGTPIIRYTDVYNNRFLHKEDITALVECNEREIEALRVLRGDVLFTRTSETVEEVGFSSVMLDDMDDCVFNGFTIKATPKTDKLLPEYCAYCFSTREFRDYVTRKCTFTTRASLTGKTLSEFLLVVPSIAKQTRIVSILNRFYSLCNDINVGLPSEIEARKKQYKYYRDKLLTFKELS